MHVVAPGKKHAAKLHDAAELEMLYCQNAQLSYKGLRMQRAVDMPHILYCLQYWLDSNHCRHLLGCCRLRFGH